MERDRGGGGGGGGREGEAEKEREDWRETGGEREGRRVRRIFFLPL